MCQLGRFILQFTASMLGSKVQLAPATVNIYQKASWLRLLPHRILLSLFETIFMTADNSLIPEPKWGENSVKQGRIQEGGGDQQDWPSPKFEHLNFWWQPSFYPAFYVSFVIAYLYFLISLFSISVFNYDWKMTILIVSLSLICIY